jgi:YHS domain-containing protein
VVEINNKICPVTGEAIQEKSKAQYTYKGKVYDFCCPMCIDEFKKDPEKYITKIGAQEAQENKAEKINPEGEHQHNH